MRSRRVRILHDGQEFYLLDTGHGARSRVLTLIRKHDDNEDTTAPRLATDLGVCVAIASWRQGEVAVEAGFESLRDPFAKICERYLEEFRIGKQRSRETEHFILTVDRQPLFTLAKPHPSGLAVLVFSDRSAAKKAAADRVGIESRPIELEECGDLADFLTARFAEGYAGAMLDDRDPIFFMQESNGQPRFLKIAPDPESGDMEHYLLGEGSHWNLYEGAESITIDLDPDDQDTLMIERLGEIPFLGFYEGIRFLAPRVRSAPDGLVLVHCEDESDSAPVCPIFHDHEHAEEFVAEHVLEPNDLVPIDDLMAFVTEVSAAGRAVRIEPGNHRARSAVLWKSGDSILLDSFSGMWRSRDGVVFTRDVD